MILDIKLVCPHCGTEFKMKEGVYIDIIHDIARLALAFGRQGWDFVELYLKSFQTAPDRPLKPEKFRLLLNEIVAFWKAEGFRFNGREWVISRDVLLAAMRHVGMAEKFGFKKHNYLKKVAIEFQQRANRKAAKEEREREQELRDPARRDPGGPRRVKEVINGLNK